MSANSPSIITRASAPPFIFYYYSRSVLSLAAPLSWRRSSLSLWKKIKSNGTHRVHHRHLSAADGTGVASTRWNLAPTLPTVRRATISSWRRWRRIAPRTQRDLRDPPERLRANRPELPEGQEAQAMKRSWLPTRRRGWPFRRRKRPSITWNPSPVYFIIWSIHIHYSAAYIIIM